MASKKQIKFEIVTPERTLMKEPVIQVTVPTESGEITVLPEHTPLVSILKPGVIEVVKIDNTLEIIAVTGGFIEVLLNKIVVLADSADRASEIDEDKAEEARKRAEESLKNLKSEDSERFTEITAQLERELARTRSVRKWRNLNKQIK